MRAAERDVLRVAHAYAEAVRETDRRRVDDEPAPKPEWSASWDRRMAHLSELMRVAATLPEAKPHDT